MAALCIIYQHYDLGGESEAFNSNNPDFTNIKRGDFGLKNWNDDARSLEVKFGTWRLWEHVTTKVSTTTSVRVCIPTSSIPSATMTDGHPLSSCFLTHPKSPVSCSADRI
jgi:hypothetical protein